MNIYMKACLAIACCLPWEAEAQTNTGVTLPAIFTDHMVLQQQSQVPVWGWGDASATVRVVGSWNTADTVSTQVDDNGHWMVRLPTGQYGGPYTLEILSTENIVVNDVMLGEVWLCSGQSNMEWTPDNGITDGQKEINEASYPGIRFFSLKKRGSRTMQEDCRAQWEQCTPDVMRRRSAIAYFFGRELHRNMDNVPVGLIVSAWGGTPAEVWVPKDSVMRYPRIADALLPQTYPWWPTQPGVLYNSMVNPLMPYGIAGAIWYQGESNRDNPSSYLQLMKELIASWRTGFGHEFPFYLAQIAPYNYNVRNNGPALVREAQERITHEVPHTGMAVTVDLGDPGNIHPARKQEVGTRLASLALGQHYGLAGIEFMSPTYKRMMVQGSKAIIYFNHAGRGLTCPDKEIRGVMIADEGGHFVPAKASIKGNTLVVSSPEVKVPVAVRYCFDDATPGNLYHRDGLPVAPFRTDGGK
ncbi:MAG: sialate O-acetylesterase [Bacteroides sp.]|nr:sialate O-acetylesterase [Bacteroides sp.]MCM1447979.1 sialate O-acetylesterase [Bacteroides sp.]